MAGVQIAFVRPEGPDVSWLDKSSGHESANVCDCLCGSVANDPSLLFFVLRLDSELQETFRNPFEGHH